MEAISDPPADIRTGQHAANHKENPFLAGVYAPLHDELSISDLTVSGQIPASLSGRYLRIGPNPYKEPAADYHWFHMHAVDGAPQRSHVQDMVETNPVVIRSTSKPDDMCWGDFRSPVHILRHAFS